MAHMENRQRRHFCRTGPFDIAAEQARGHICKTRPAGTSAEQALRPHLRNRPQGHFLQDRPCGFFCISGHDGTSAKQAVKTFLQARSCGDFCRTGRDDISAEQARGHGCRTSPEGTSAEPAVMAHRMDRPWWHACRTARGHTSAKTPHNGMPPEHVVMALRQNMPRGDFASHAGTSAEQATIALLHATQWRRIWITCRGGWGVGALVPDRPRGHFFITGPDGTFP